MTPEIFHQKRKQYVELYLEFRDYILPIAEKYIEYKKINFNYPQRFEFRDNCVFVIGKDGCRGCYVPMSLEIPYRYFEDYDKEINGEIEKENQQKEKERMERIERIKLQNKSIEKFEYQQYLRLKEKYEI